MVLVPLNYKFLVPFESLVVVDLFTNIFIPLMPDYKYTLAPLQPQYIMYTPTHMCEGVLYSPHTASSHTCENEAYIPTHPHNLLLYFHAYMYPPTHTASHYPSCHTPTHTQCPIIPHVTDPYTCVHTQLS